MDPGHGPSGSGANRDWGDFYIDEAVVNFKISQYTKQALETNYPNIEVYLTRETQNDNPKLANRVAFAVEKKADLLVSQHINSTDDKITTASGVLAIVPTVDEEHAYHQETALLAQKLARKILDKLVILGFEDNGFTYRLSENNTLYPDGSLADYYAIVRDCRKNNIPGTIIEHGFCNNAEDAIKLSTEESLMAIGEADAQGIVEYMVEFLGYVIDIPSEEPEELPTPFTDVKKGDYYCDAVLWAVEQGITTGMTPTEFGVENACTRAQGITFLWRYEQKPPSDLIVLPFTDINTKEYYYDALRWALQYNITTGTTETTFSPDESLTRGQFITFLWRAAGMPEPTTTSNPFVDVDENDYFYNSVLWAVENGITTGTTESTFSPDDTCLRVHVVTFLMRVANMENSDSDSETPGDDTTNSDDSDGNGFTNNENTDGEDSGNDNADDSEGSSEPEDPFLTIDPSLPIDATEYGLSVEDDGTNNSYVLQRLIDVLSPTGGTIHIPSGTYAFAETGKQTIGSHCIKMKSNIKIIGDGESTVLKPTGATKSGLDMFYFNDYVDIGKANYLENCHFESFVIDSENTSSSYYSSAGKGFMFNLFKDCTWKKITVKNTDGTGFGVDCPIGGSMEDCIAINCGKAAKTSSPGASGFGIGFGYAKNESFTITNCQAYDNKVYGFFFEHQGRFNKTKYTAPYTIGFLIKDCTADGNYYNYGGMLTNNTMYRQCTSIHAKKCGYYFENSRNSSVVDCSSESDGENAFYIAQTDNFGGTQEVSNLVFRDCIGSNVACGVRITSLDSEAIMGGNLFLDSSFIGITETVVATAGAMESLVLTGNTSDNNTLDLSAEIAHFINLANSWNTAASVDSDFLDTDSTTEESTVAEDLLAPAA